METNQDVKFVKTKHEFVNELPFREGQLIFVEDMDIVLKDKDDGSRRVISGTPVLRTKPPSEDRGTGAEYEVDIRWFTSEKSFVDGDTFVLIPHAANTGANIDVVNGKKFICCPALWASGAGVTGPLVPYPEGYIYPNEPIVIHYSEQYGALVTYAGQLSAPENILIPKDMYIVGSGNNGYGIAKTPEEVREHIGAFPTSGGTITGNVLVESGVDVPATFDFGWRPDLVSLGGGFSHLRGIQSPYNPDDAANKEYVDTKAAKSTVVSATITTSWSGSEAPWTQTISVSGVTATSVVEAFLPASATAEQVEAYQELNLQDGGQAEGSITLRAFGEKNTSEIPITVIVRGDL